jgi:hypothetical protein
MLTGLSAYDKPVSRLTSSAGEGGGMRRLQPSEWLAKLTGPDHTKVKKTVGRVCQLASGDASYLEVLREALAQPNDKRVFWIVTDLGSLGPNARVAVPELVQLLNRRPPFGTRQAILGALADIAPDSAEAKAAILEAFSDPDPSVRCDALLAVSKLADLSPVDLGKLREMGTDTDKHVAFWSEVALRNIGARGQKPAEPSAPADGPSMPS